MEKKRILFINTTFKNEGPTNAIWPLLKGLSPKRYDTVAACMHAGGPFEQRVASLGIPSVNFHLDYPWSLGAVPRMLQYLKQQRIDLIHAQLLRAETAGSIAGKLTGIPVILHVHSTDAYRNSVINPVRFLACRFASTNASAIIAVSDAVRKFIIKEQHVHPSRVHTLHNAIEANRIRHQVNRYDILQPLGLERFKCLAVTVCRIVRPKGIDHLLAAIAKLGHIPSHEFGAVIIGDGPERQSLSRLAKRLGIEERIRFLGHRDDIADILGAFDMFVLPSMVEGLPMSILEAMAAGLPTIGTRVSGIPELIADGESGLLVEPGQRDELAWALSHLASDQALRKKMGACGRDRVLKLFSPKTAVARYEKIITSVWAQKDFGSTA